MMKSDKRLLFIYNLCFCLLAVIAIILAVLDFSSGLSQWQSILDVTIAIIFIADYFIRLLLSDDKKNFFKENVFDLIAIIPFSSLFKIFRIFKFIKMLKFIKLIRFSAYFARLYRHAKHFFNITGLKYMVAASLICIVIGGVSIRFAEGTSLLDGVWLAFVTVTTVGYGDISPATLPGRITASILMIVGIGLIGSLTSTITALFFDKETKKQPLSAKGEIIQSIQRQLDNFDDLTKEDINVICTTLNHLHDDSDK